MENGIIKVNKTNKGKIFVEINDINENLIVSATYLSLPNLELNGKECEYSFRPNSTILKSLFVGGIQVFPHLQERFDKGWRFDKSAFQAGNCLSFNGYVPIFHHDRQFFYMAEGMSFALEECVGQILLNDDGVHHSYFIFQYEGQQKSFVKSIKGVRPISVFLERGNWADNSPNIFA